MIDCIRIIAWGPFDYAQGDGPFQGRKNGPLNKVRFLLRNMPAYARRVTTGPSLVSFTS